MPPRSLAAPAVLLALWGAASAARGQTLPTGQQFATEYKFAEMKEVKKVEWKASAAAGFTLAAGNANVLTLSGGANATRNDGKNLLMLDFSGVYALTTVPITIDRDMTGAICAPMSTMNGCNGIVDRGEEVGSQGKTTAGFFLLKGRYDRFFTANNAGFLIGFVGLDIPAAKKLITGGQLGYSRQLVKTKMHEIKAELGADVTYNDYVLAEGSTGSPSVFLASARLFVSYNLSIGDNTQFTARAESLINLNPATVVERRAASGDATRVNAQLALTTKIWGRLSFRFGFGLRYDNCPAPNPNLKFADYSLIGRDIIGSTTCSQQERQIESGEGYDANTADALRDLAIYRVKYNQKLDLLTEANLVFNFL